MDVQFVVDARVFGFHVHGWIYDDSFDFFRSMALTVRYWQSLTLLSLGRRLPNSETPKHFLLTVRKVLALQLLYTTQVDSPAVFLLYKYETHLDVCDQV